MSNSSDVSETVAAGLKSDRLIVHLLHGIAHECTMIGSEIARVGAALSPLVVAAEKNGGLRELQAFDALAQNAHTQAALIAHLAGILLLGCDLSMEVALAQLEGIPLPAVRERMREAVGARAAPACMPDDSDDTTLWLSPLASDEIQADRQ